MLNTPEKKWDSKVTSPELRDGEHLSRFRPYVDALSPPSVNYPKPGELIAFQIWTVHLFRPSNFHALVFIGVINPRSVAEIDVAALVNNGAVVKRIAEAEYDCQSISVLKADAYGHGAVNVARLLQHSELSRFFAVATLPEALELRAAEFSERILILGRRRIGFLFSLSLNLH